MNSNFDEELSKAYKETYDTLKCYEILTNCYNILNHEEFKLSKENLEKLKRMAIRNNIILNIMISQIYLRIIKNEDLFDKISDNSFLLISLGNEIIKIIDSLSQMIINEDIYLLKKQVIKLIRFIYINYKSKLDEEKILNLKDLILELQSKYFSQIYQKVIINYNRYLNEERNFDIKFLNDYLSETFSLDEQFDIINDLFKNNFFNHEKMKDATSIIQYGKLLMDFIFFDQIKIIIKEEEENLNEDNNIFLLLDAVKNVSNQIQFKSNENIKTDFLNEKKFIINQYNNSTKNLTKIINSFIEYIHQNNNKFQTNNKEVVNITSYLSNILINIDNKDYFKEINLNNFSLEIGHKNKINIFAGESEYINIDTKYNNSIVYIEFEIKDNDENDKDINFNLFKYQKIEKTINNNDLKDEIISFYDFQILYNLKNIDKPTKIILFSQTPSLYKIEFDNNYSWVKGKEILYRIIILKSLENEIVIPENDIQIDTNIYCYYEGINQTFLMNEIEKDINKMKEYENNEKNEIIISILIYFNILRIINIDEDKLNYIEFKDENKDNIISNIFFEKTIQNYIKSLNLKNEDKIILNIFSLNHNLSSYNEKTGEILDALTTKTINNSINYEVINSIKKIGIFSSINKKIPNLNYQIFYFTDLSLIYFLYKSIEEKIYLQNSLLLINFDKYTSNVTIFNEGGIYNNLKGFPYNNNNYEEIKNNYISFIEKANNSFDGILLVITFTYLYYNLKELFFGIINQIKETCTKLDPPVKVYFYDDDKFISEVFKYIHIFYKEKNRKI